MSSDLPDSSTTQVPVSSIQHHASDPQVTVNEPLSLLFVTHHVLEDQASAATKAICQAGLMMERMKTVQETSQDAYDGSAALRDNVQVSWFPTDLLS